MSTAAHTGRAHAQWGASSAKRWMTCPGSVALCATVPDESTVYAAEGTAAHELAQLILGIPSKPNLSATKYVGSLVDIDAGKLLTRGTPDNRTIFGVTDEMAEAVDVYLDVLRGDQRDFGGELTVEHRFDLSEHVHPGMFGTNDAMLLNCTDGVLRVYDYKHGRGVPVDVEDNPQLKYYALGALCAVDFKGVKEIEVVIVQPRCDHEGGAVRRWRCRAVDLDDFGYDLEDAVKASKAPDASCVAGDHCRSTFCPAIGICPAFRAHATERAGIEFADDGTLAARPPEMIEAANQTLGHYLAAADELEAWIAAVRRHAFLLMEKGTEVPGWKLVEKRALRRYTDEDGAYRHLVGLGFDEDRITGPRKLLSPAQIEKVVGKDAYAEIAEDFIEKKSSGLTLAAESDPRKAMNVPLGAEFGDLDDEI